LYEGFSTLFSHKLHVVVHNFTEFSINADQFQLFEDKLKNIGVLRTGHKIYVDPPGSTDWRLRATALKNRIIA